LVDHVKKSVGCPRLEVNQATVDKLGTSVPKAEPPLQGVTPKVFLNFVSKAQNPDRAVEVCTRSLGLGRRLMEVAAEEIEGTQVDILEVHQNQAWRAIWRFGDVFDNGLVGILGLIRPIKPHTQPIA